MQKRSDYIDIILGLDDQKTADLLQVVYERDYGAIALSHIDNHPRILNYLDQAPYNLLPSNNFHGRRRYSLMDLLWIGIITECRKFGMEKEQLFTLKNHLWGTDAEVIVNEVSKNKKEVEKMLQGQGLNSIQAKALADELLKNKEKILELSTTRLLQFTLSAIHSREPHYFLITMHGECITYTENNFETLRKQNTFFIDFFRKPHLSICLNEILGFFISKEFIEDKLKESFFTNQEWEVINLVRQPNTTSLTIMFRNNKPEEYSITKKTKVAVEARLTEVMSKCGYDKLEVITNDGHFVYGIKTTRGKL